MEKTMDFDQAFDRLLGNEGGYTNDPQDHGGETMWGITIKEARAHGYTGNMRDLSKEFAKQIYRESYWDILGDAVHPAIKFQAFDFGVNAGVQTSIRKLQSAIGVADDGKWGPISAAKLASMDLNDVLMRFAAARLYFYTSLSTWPSFGKGWTRRIANDLNLAADDN
jgi:lysozyme family protein